MKTYLTKPLLMIACILIILGMLRAGIWQLDRADEKRLILDQQEELAASQPVSLVSTTELRRFLPVEVEGRFLAEKTIYLDNQVIDSKVGYRVFTPFKIGVSGAAVLVDRGWIGVGDSRSELPEIRTPVETQRLVGRLNEPAAAPPLWNDEFSVMSGAVWQFLPIPEISDRLQLELLPMVVELPPDFEGETDSRLVRRWASIDDQWVARHNAYAFQWFAMALTLSIACLILIFIGIRRRPKSS